MAATEDSWAHTIVPRLMAASADLNRVFRVDVTTGDGVETTLSLPRDLSALARVTTDVQAAAIILDPLLSRLDSALDTHKDAEVRRALEPLVKVADESEACVLGVIHVNKSTSADPLTLLMGSRAFAAVARSVLFVMVDPEDENQRLLGQPKNNLGRADLPTLAFQINGVCVAETDAEAVSAAAASVDDRSATSEAADWLEDVLTSVEGRQDVAVLVRDGRQAGHSKNALYRARKRLRLISESEGFPRRAYWVLPSPVVPSLGESGANGTTGATAAGESPSSPISPIRPSLPTPPAREMTAGDQPQLATARESVRQKEGQAQDAPDDKRTGEDDHPDPTRQAEPLRSETLDVAADIQEECDEDRGEQVSEPPVHRHILLGRLERERAVGDGV